MSHYGRLYWVQKNRRRVNRERLVGPLVASLADRAASLATGRAEIDAVLKSVVDAEFQRHCRVFLLADGVLSIAVDAPGRVFTLRRRWSEPLKEAFRGSRIGKRIRKITFEYRNE